jgi:hypothetical protein
MTGEIHFIDTVKHRNHVYKRDTYPAQYEAVTQQLREWNQKPNLEIFKSRVKTKPRV